MTTFSPQPLKLSRRGFLRAAPAGMGIVALSLAGCCDSIPATQPEAMRRCLENANGGGGTIPVPSLKALEAWGPSSAEMSLNAIFANYNESLGRENGVEVSFVPMSGQTDERLLTAIAGGTSPALYFVNRSSVIGMAHQGVLTGIADFAADAGVSEEAYYPFAWQEVAYRSDIYALPFDTDTRALLYNKVSLEEAGFSPEAPQTFDEWRAMAAELTMYDALGHIERMGCNPIYDQAVLYTWGFCFGGQFQDPLTRHITFADANNIEAMYACKEWIDEIGTEAVIDLLAQDDGSGFDSDLFFNNRVAMTISSTWRLATLRQFNADTDLSELYGVAPMPGPEGPAPHASWSAGSSWTIPTGTERVEEAVDVLAYLCGSEGQLQYCKALHRLPTHIATVEDPFFREEPLLARFAELLEVSHARPQIPLSDELWRLQYDVLRNEIAQGEKSPEEALTDIDTTVNNALESAGFFLS